MNKLIFKIAALAVALSSGFAAGDAQAYEPVYKFGNYTFTFMETRMAFNNMLTISVASPQVNDSHRFRVDGIVTDIQVDDRNRDDRPEVYIVSKSVENQGMAEINRFELSINNSLDLIDTFQFQMK